MEHDFWDEPFNWDIYSEGLYIPKQKRVIKNIDNAIRKALKKLEGFNEKSRDPEKVIVKEFAYYQIELLPDEDLSL